MKHAYWRFRCKTAGCIDFNIVKYIGPQARIRKPALPKSGHRLLQNFLSDKALWTTHSHIIR